VKSVVKKLCLLSVWLVIRLGADDYPQDAAVIAKGKALFTAQCAACHALTTDGFGPPLGGVTALLAPARLEAWIRDPARVVADGDAREEESAGGGDGAHDAASGRNLRMRNLWRPTTSPGSTV